MNKKQSRAWELHALSFIKSQTSINHKVIDINTLLNKEDMYELYRQDVDILVIHQLPDGSIIDTAAYEVKADDRISNPEKKPTNNIFLEYRIEHPKPFDRPDEIALCRTYHKIEPYSENGWLHFSKADYLLYIDTHKQTMYKIPLPALKAHVLANTDKWKIGVAYGDNRYYKGQIVEQVNSYGYCVNISYVLENIEGCTTFKNIGKPTM